MALDEPTIKKKKQIIKERLSWHDLFANVIGPDRCCSCGACAGFCPKNVIEVGGSPAKAINLEACIPCNICTNVCPRFGNKDELKPKGNTWDELIGGYLSLYKGKSLLEVKNGQDSGSITAILAAALEAGEIDGAVVVGRDSKWKAIPQVATTVDELIGAAGSKYTSSSSVELLKEAASSGQYKSLAHVGVPCQAEAVRRLTNSMYKNIAKNIKFTVGLFCSEVFLETLLTNKLEKEMKVPLSTIKKVDFKGKLLIHAEKTYELAIDEIKSHVLPGCFVCTDFAGEFADLGAGAVGVRKGWTNLIPRTEISLKILNIAKESGYLQLEEVSEKSLRIPKVLTEHKRKRVQTRFTL
ncbi:MAG: F(420)H(2) dehydrogenase subunit F [Candidatus Heimdallarchaeota archaeon LC_3]|nr:MAG: F(420)H(2) dehydrogenase subunit F [Candidatus Heimdallarchaeota archaeon LC_3]